MLDGLTMKAIYLNGSFVRLLGPKAQPIRNITGRAHRHYVAEAFDSFVPSGLPTPALPVVIAFWAIIYVDVEHRGSILVTWGMLKSDRRRERVRLPMVKKRSKLAKSSDRAQKNAFFYLRFLVSFRRSRDFICVDINRVDLRMTECR